MPTANRRFRRRALGIAALLAAQAGLVAVPVASAQTVKDDILMSLRPDGTSPTPLEGARVSGSLYAFTRLESGVRSVKFYIDDPSMSGEPMQVEGSAPFTLNGDTKGTMTPFDTTVLVEGVHTVTASLSLKTGKKSVVSAAFTVDNVPDPVPVTPPSAVNGAILFSAKSTGEAPIPLDGATVSGPLYAFARDEAGVNSVRFYMDDPSGAGTPVRSEWTAPFSLAGDVGDMINPYDTTTLFEGQHTVTAKLALSDGTTVLHSAAFTVDNVPETVPVPTPAPITTVPQETDEPAASAPSDGQELAWAPPSTAGYSTYNVPTSGGIITLEDSIDYVLQMPSTPVTRTLTIKGGRNVILIGGHIRRDTFSSHSESVQAAVRIFKSDKWTEANRLNDGRIVFIEGLLADGYYLSDGLHVNAPEANVYLQNSRVELGMWGRISGTDWEGGSPHPDVIQPWGGVKHLYVDKLTGLTTYQGFMLKSDYYDHLNDGRTLRRVNLRAQEPHANIELNDPNPPSTDALPSDRSWPNYLWWTDGQEGVVTVDDVWLAHPNRSFDGGRVLWPHGYGTGNDVNGHYAIPVGANGRVYEGAPPGGDFVPESVPGTSYQSPGYQ